MPSAHPPPTLRARRAGRVFSSSKASSSRPGCGPPPPRTGCRQPRRSSPLWSCSSPCRISTGCTPRWLLPAAELVLLAVLSVLNPVRLTRATRLGKYTSLLVVAVITVDNASSAGLLDYDILSGKASQDAGGLLSAGAAIYLTNIIAFGLWFWEIDRGGPFTRAQGSRTHPDFLFPQMASPQLAHPDWEPRFVDYLYVSFTNAVAFSPTDTLPLTRPVKALMALQSLVALSTVGLVIARAVNVLK